MFALELKSGAPGFGEVFLDRAVERRDRVTQAGLRVDEAGRAGPRPFDRDARRKGCSARRVSAPGPLPRRPVEVEDVLGHQAEHCQVKCGVPQRQRIRQGVEDPVHPGMGALDLGPRLRHHLGRQVERDDLRRARLDQRQGVPPGTATDVEDGGRRAARTMPGQPGLPGPSEGCHRRHSTKPTRRNRPEPRVPRGILSWVSPWRSFLRTQRVPGAPWLSVSIAPRSAPVPRASGRHALPGRHRTSPA